MDNAARLLNEAEIRIPLKAREVRVGGFKKRDYGKLLDGTITFLNEDSKESE